MSIFQSLQKHFETVSGTLLVLNQFEIEKAVRILEEVRKAGGFVWIMGNGGSAATASHFANDLEKMVGVRAISIPDMVSKVLAYGNDNGWERMFSDVVRKNIGVEDAVVVISCSGNSRNVVHVAQDHAYNRLIVLTGNDEESVLAQMGANAMISAPAEDIKVQEDVHLAVCHAIVAALVG